MDLVLCTLEKGSWTRNELFDFSLEKKSRNEIAAFAFLLANYLQGRSRKKRDRHWAHAASAVNSR